MKSLLLFLALPFTLLAQDPEPNGYVALEKEGYIMFGYEDMVDGMTDEVDFKNQDIATDFVLQGKKPIEYRIKLEDNETGILLRKGNDGWIIQDTLVTEADLWEWREGWPLVSPFRVIDFDNDGNQDLVCIESIGGHNEMSTVIYLNSPKFQKLVKLYDMAEDSYSFVNPEYDAKKHLLKTYISGGTYSISISSTYKINEGIAVPLMKTEIDLTNEEQTVNSNYKGKNGKWVLESAVKHKKSK